MANFDKMLQEGIRLAKSSLNDARNNYLDKAKKDYLATTKAGKYTREIDKLKYEKNIINNNIKLLEDKIKLEDRDITSAERELEGVSYYGKHSDYIATKQYISSDIYSNMKGMEDISNKFTQAMNIAIGTKEQRQILSNFYSLDWKELGIELPIDTNIGDIKIQGGKIIVSNKLLK